MWCIFCTHTAQQLKGDIGSLTKSRLAGSAKPSYAYGVCVEGLAEQDMLRQLKLGGRDGKKGLKEAQKGCHVHMTHASGA